MGFRLCEQRNLEERPWKVETQILVEWGWELGGWEGGEEVMFGWCWWFRNSKEGLLGAGTTEEGCYLAEVPT